MAGGTGQWVVLELSSRSEGEDPELIIRSIQKGLKAEAEVFVPALVTEIGDDRAIHWLAQGYAFVRSGLPDSAYLRLEGSRFVQSVLTDIPTGNNRRVALVPDSNIERMRQQLRQEVHQGIGVGDRVLITTGPYKNVEATVIEEFPRIKQVQVHVKLRSKETLLMIPRSGLQVVERAPLSPVRSKLMALQTWIQMARVPLNWTGNMQGVERSFERYNQLEGWSSKGRKLYAFVSFYHQDMGAKLSEIQVLADEAVQLEVWDDRFQKLWAFVASFYGFMDPSQLASIEAKMAKVEWFEQMTQRIKKLRREVEAIGHKGAKRRKPGGRKVIQNLLVDGYNMAFRSHHAPGLRDLKDSQGRPTGMVVGFLRSLGSLRKRYPEARVYVAWDGSSARRKKVYPDYKGNRTSSSDSLNLEAVWASPPAADEPYHPVVFLMRLLPYLGVYQVFNPAEEADDIIATMARGELSGQHNLIFSSDRDFLQLVSETTMLLTPGVGSRKEILFDVAAVKKHFGVHPGRMVQIRAFFGDKSDNLPGVTRVPKKVLKALVQAHGSVDGVYSSGLTGLSKGQYERLRSAEPQVRINAKLMRLEDVPVSRQEPDPDPDAVAKRLRGLDINPVQVVGTFLGTQ